MFEKLEDVQLRLEEVLSRLSDPDVSGNPSLLQSLMREQAELQPVADAYSAYRKNEAAISESLELLESEGDPEMRDMLKEELQNARSQKSELEQKLKLLLLPKDPNDEKNVIFEIRAGAGGEEAALFA